MREQEIETKLQHTAHAAHAQRSHARRRRHIVEAMAVAVAMLTLIALTIPAFTLEKTAFCGMVEHTHTEACYTTVSDHDEDLLAEGHEIGEQVLTCGLEAHEHTADCFVNPDAFEDGTDLHDMLEDGTIASFATGAHVDASFVTADAVETEQGEPVDFTPYIDSTLVKGKADGEWSAAAAGTADDILINVGFSIPEGVITDSSTTAVYQLPRDWTVTEPATGKIRNGFVTSGMYSVDAEGLVTFEFDESFANGNAVVAEVAFTGVMRTAAQEEAAQEEQESQESAEPATDGTDASEDADENAFAGVMGVTSSAKSVKKLAAAPRKAAAASSTIKMDDSWVKSVSVLYQGQNETNNWRNVTSDTKLSLSDKLRFLLNYTIPGGTLGNGANTVTYQIPNAIRPVDTVSGQPVYDSSGKQVGTYSISTDANSIGTVTVTFNDDFVSQNAEGLPITGHVAFTASVSSIESGDSETITLPFASSVTQDITIDKGDSKDLHVNKGQSQINDDGTITYTVTVWSKNGTNSGITLNDVMSGGVVYNGSFNVKKNGTQAYIGNAPSKGATNFSYTLPQMAAGDSYTITYTGKVENWNLTNGQVSKVGNQVTVKSTGKDSQEITDTAKVETSVTPITKSGELKDGKVVWTIKVRTFGKDIGGFILNDSYYGKQVEKAKLDGVEVNLPYTFPAGSTKSVYTFTVETGSNPNVGEWNSTNTAMLYPSDGGSGIGGSGTVYTGENNPLKKEGVSLTEQSDGTYQVKWNVTIDSASGPIECSADLNDGDATPHWVFTDKLGNGDAGYQQYFDETQMEIIRNVVQTQFSNALGGSPSDYIVTFDMNEYSYTVKSYYDMPQGKKIELNYLTTVKITDKTNPYNFKNTASINNKVWSTGSVPFTPVLQKFDPQASNGKYDTSTHDWDDKEIIADGNKGVLKWEFWVNLPAGAQAPVTITESLPEGTTLYEGNQWDLELRIAKALHESGAGKFDFNSERTVGTWTNTYEADGKTVKRTATATYDHETNQIVIKLDQDFLDTLGDNSQLNFVIRAQVDSSGVEWIEDDTHGGVKYHQFTNKVTVEYGKETVTDEQTQDITKDENKDVLAKSGDEIKGNVVPYHIVVNPEGRDLLEGSDTLTMKDVLTYTGPMDQGYAMSLIPDSYKVYEYDNATKIKGADITDQCTYTYDSSQTGSGWFMSTNTITTIIPDGKALYVEYAYRVSGPAGSTLYNVSNTVSLQGVKTNHTETYQNSSIKVQGSEAQADIDGVWVYKVDATNLGMMLAGAKFKLEKWDGSQWVEITPKKGAFVSGSDGKLTLTSDNIEGGLVYNTAYRLTETEIPGTVNGKQYTVSNEPCEFYVFSSDTTKYPKKFPDGFNGEMKNVGDIIIFKNTGLKDTNLKVVKKWADADGNEIEKTDGSIDFELWRRVVKASDADDVTTTVTTNIMSGNDKSNFRKDAPLTLTYPEGTTVDLHLEFNNGSTQVNSWITGSLYFKLAANGTETVYRPVWVEERACYTIDIASLRVAANATYQLTAEGGLDSQYWPFELSIVDYALPAAVTQANGTDEFIGSHSISASDGWEWNSVTMPSGRTGSDGTAFRYIYYVKETGAAALDCNVSYDGNYVFGDSTITITNASSEIAVHKKWVDQNGNPMTRASGEITFDLKRRYTDADVPTLELVPNLQTGSSSNFSAGQHIYLRYPTGTTLNYIITCTSASDDKTQPNDWQAGATYFTYKGVKYYGAWNSDEHLYYFTIPITVGSSESVALDCTMTNQGWTWNGYVDESSVVQPSCEVDSEVVGTYSISAGTGWAWSADNLPTVVTINGKEYACYYYVEEHTTDTLTTDMISYENNDGIRTGDITITNVYRADFILPSTGGEGTVLYTLAGALLVGCAAFLLYRNVRRRKEAYQR